MKNYQIVYQSPIAEGINELNNYLHQRINEIENDFSLVENCDVELSDENYPANNCEVTVKLFIPRHVYVAIDRESTFIGAAEKVFDELQNQLNGWKYG